MATSTVAVSLRHAKVVARGEGYYCCFLFLKQIIIIIIFEFQRNIFFATQCHALVTSKYIWHYIIIREEWKDVEVQSTGYTWPTGWGGWETL